MVGKTLLEVFPALESGWLETFGRVALTDESANFEMYAAELGITFDVSAYRPASNQYACTFSDITERKHAEALLAEQLDELRRWQQAMIGREDRIITVKQEVNELLARSGQPPRYAPQLPAEPGEVDA